MAYTQPEPPAKNGSPPAPPPEENKDAAPPVKPKVGFFRSKKEKPIPNKDQPEKKDNLDAKAVSEPRSV